MLTVRSPSLGQVNPFGPGVVRSKRRLSVMRILFLDPIKQSSKREHELRDAAARSHAAKVSHFRMKSRFKARTSWSSPANVQDVVTGGMKGLESGLPEHVDLFPATSIYTGFGYFRSEILDLLHNEASAGDLHALDFFVEVTMLGTDVANEMFDRTGPLNFLLPNLVSLALY